MLDRPETLRRLIALRAAVPPMASHAEDLRDLGALIDAVASEVPPTREQVADELERLAPMLGGEPVETARCLADDVRGPWQAGQVPRRGRGDRPPSRMPPELGSPQRNGRSPLRRCEVSSSTPYRFHAATVSGVRVTVALVRGPVAKVGVVKMPIDMDAIPDNADDTGRLWPPLTPGPAAPVRGAGELGAALAEVVRRVDGVFAAAGGVEGRDLPPGAQFVVGVYRAVTWTAGEAAEAPLSLVATPATTRVLVGERFLAERVMEGYERGWEYAAGVWAWLRWLHTPGVDLVFLDDTGRTDCYWPFWQERFKKR